MQKPVYTRNTKQNITILKYFIYIVYIYTVVLANPPTPSPLVEANIYCIFVVIYCNVFQFRNSFPYTGIFCMHTAHCASTISNESDFQQCKISDGLVQSRLSGAAYICTTEALFLQQQQQQKQFIPHRFWYNQFATYFLTLTQRNISEVLEKRWLSCVAVGRGILDFEIVFVWAFSFVFL